MNYKGYDAKVEFDDEAGLFHGRLLNLRDVITFQGTTVAELRHEFAESVDDYLEWCAERGEEPEKPCSGKFVLRIEPELHRDIIVAAELSAQSLNSWIVDVLQTAVRHPIAKNRKTVPTKKKDSEKFVVKDIEHARRKSNPQPVG